MRLWTVFSKTELGTSEFLEEAERLSHTGTREGTLPLRGIRVVELGQLIAGPFCGKVLADFGAEVIKIESPTDGDPLRKWRLMKHGTSVWWQVQSLNKLSVAVDLRTVEGQDIVRQLAVTADVLIENFKPGTLEAWDLGWERLHAENPKLILLRVSGYGQDGPYRNRPGFGAIAEAVGGLRHLTGEPGRIPVRMGIAIGDTLAALHGAIGVLTALRHRDANGGDGQVVDVALYESVFNCTDSMLSEYSALGVVRQPAGSALPGVVPSNAYACTDGTLLVAGNGDSIFRRLMQAIGRRDLAADPALQSNEGRVAHAEEIDAAIRAWAAALPLKYALEVLEDAGVPASAIYTVKDIVKDPHYTARGMLERVTTRDGDELLVPGVVPKLMKTPGSHRTPAPALGQHTESILRRLGLDESQIRVLEEKRVISRGMPHSA